MQPNDDTSDLLERLLVTIIALVSFIVGVGLLSFAKYAQHRPGWQWLAFWPLSEIGGILTAGGIFGVAYDYQKRRTEQRREDARDLRFVKAAAPAFRDAVIAGFAETPEQMRGVATTETLDKLATNALALRLGDENFAREIYAELLAQAIRTPERWHDVDVAIRLSSVAERSTSGAARGDTVPSSLFDVIVTWEYSVRPSRRMQKFASTNDQSYTVDGVAFPIHHARRKHGQTYSVDLGAEIVARDKSVRIRHIYRTVSRRVGHRFRVALVQPTEGLHVSFDYSNTDIAELKVGDMVSSARPAQVSFLPADAPARQVEVVVPGWLLPQAEVTFVWTLSSELPS